MKRLWMAAALAPLSFAAAAQAQQTISSGTATPVTTANGGDVTIDSGGSIVPTTAGTATAQVSAVTVNSNNNTASTPTGGNATNEGAITFTGLNYTTGVTAQGGFTGSVSNTGTITNNETTGYIDTNSDNIVDTNTANNANKIAGVYLFASGTNRFGIQIAPTGAAAFTGSVSNSGTITIIGENSAGIEIGAGGLNGALLNSGAISVTGGNPYINSTVFPAGNNNGTDVSYGIQSTGDITGNVTLSDTISTIGKNSIGVSLGAGANGYAVGNAASVGGVSGGNLEVYGTITSTGYETTSPIQSTSLNVYMLNQANEELLQGGPALQISGSVSGGVSLDAAVVGGVTSSTTTTAVAGAVITSDGSAPAVLIGGSTPLTISPIVGTATSASVTASGVGTTYSSTIGASSSGFGIVVGGSISGVGLYPVTEYTTANGVTGPIAISATGMALGATWSPNSIGQYVLSPSAGTATIQGGVNITGTLEASTTGAQVTTTTSTSGVLTSTTDLPTGNATALLIDNAALTPNTASTNPLNTAVSYGALNVSGSVIATVSTQTVVGTGSNANYTQTIGTGASADKIIYPINSASQLPTATAIQINHGANVPSIVNTGVIEAAVGGISTAVITSNGGTEGYASAIVDKSGTLTSITNENTILAEVTPVNAQDLVNPAYSRTIAIDLSSGSSPTVVTQGYASTPVLALDSITDLTTVVTPSITGDVLFGSGASKLDLEAGTLEGGISFGSSTGNEIDIAGGAIALGPLAEAPGGQLYVNVYNGLLGISTPTTNVLDDALGYSAPTTYNGVAGAPQVAIGVSKVSIGANGQLVFSVFAPSGKDSPATVLSTVGAPQFNVSGAVTIASGGAIGLNFLSKLTQTTTYDVIEAANGQINIANTATALGQLPYLYTGTLSVAQLSPTEQAVAITVSQKSIAQLGLNKAQSAAFSAFYAAFDKTETPGVDGLSGDATGNVASAVLTQTTKADFQHLYNEFLPAYSGGVFNTMVTAQDELAAAEADTPTKLQSTGSRGWVQEIGVSDDRTSNGVVGYSGVGFGLAGGTEVVDGRNAIGLAGALITTQVGENGEPAGSSQSATAVEGGIYWHNGGEGLNVGASANGGWVFLQSHRVMLEQSGDNDATFFREAKSNSDGAVASATLNIAYKQSFGRFFIKPEALAEYVLLYESAYSETGAGPAADLNVHSQLNKEGVVQGDMVMGATFGDAIHWTPSLTLGWRQVVYGGPASTTASFQGGTPFTLSPDYQDERGGLLARLGLRASGNYADFSANAGGVFRPGYDSYDARATARFLF